MKLSFSEFCLILFSVPLPIYRNFSGSFVNETYGWRVITLLLCLFVKHFVQMTHKNTMIWKWVLIFWDHFTFKALCHLETYLFVWKCLCMVYIGTLTVAHIACF